MQPLGIASVMAGIYLLYCAVKNLAPLDTIKELIASPKDYASILTNSSTPVDTYAGQTTPTPASGSNTPPPAQNSNVAAEQAYAQSLFSKYGWSSDQLNYLIELWNKESGWRVDAYNASSGATGIPQALPGSKMATFGTDYLTNYKTQIQWGLSYIAGRYGSPQAAWAHETANNWY